MLTDSVSAYGLNLYSLCLTNPVDLAYNEYTIEPGVELTYVPDFTKGDCIAATISSFWKSPYGKGFAIALFVAATLLAIFVSAIREMYFKTLLGVAITLLIGAAIAGLIAIDNGDPFWDSFLDYLNDNWSQTLAVSMAVFIAVYGISLSYHTYYTPNDEHAAKTVTESGVEIQKATKGNFTSEAWDEIQSLPRDANGNTVSNLKSGRKIHYGFMKDAQGSHISGGGSHGGKGYFDGYNKARKIVYELKPNNPASIKRGIAQLQRYQRALIAQGKGVHKLILVVY